MTRRVGGDAAGIAEGIAHLCRGEVVGVPTETVYGLAGRAFDAVAVARIFAAKGRPAFDPLIVHLAGREELARVAEVPREVGEMVECLMDRFWPGPLTLVLPRRPEVVDLVTSGLETVAVRCTAHPVMAALIRGAGPLAAPSANRFGRISPTTAEAVMEELGGRIPLIVDGGPVVHGVESTIVRPYPGDRLEVLRPGPVTMEALQAMGTVTRAGVGEGLVPEAPGMLARHYAPGKRMRLQSLQVGLPDIAAACAVVGWREVPPWLQREAGAHAVLAPSGDPVEGAARLYGVLRAMDACPVRWLVVEPPSIGGIGTAICDRLERAAAGSGGIGDGAGDEEGGRV